MKISKKDLSKDIVKKLELLEEIEKSEGFIRVKDGKIETYNLDIRPNNLEFTNEEVLKMSDLSLSKRNHNINSIDDIITTANYINPAFPSNKILVKRKKVYELDSNIRIFRQIKNMIVILTEKGTLIVYRNSFEKPIFTMDLIKEINENFGKIYIFDINDIDICGEYILVAMKKYGVLKINNYGKIEELFIVDQGIFKIKSINKKILVALYSNDIDNNVKLFDVETGRYIQGFNHLRYDTDQKPIDLHVGDDYFAVLGSPMENDGSYMTIHFWVKDENGYYINVDQHIYPHTNDISYRSKFIIVNEKYIYVIGRYYNKTFIWRWFKNNLSAPHDELFLNIDFKYIDNVYIKDNIITLNTKNSVYRFDLLTGDLIGNLRLENVESISGFYEEDGVYTVFDENTINIYELPEVKIDNTIKLDIENYVYDHYKIVIKTKTPDLVNIDRPNVYRYGNHVFFTFNRDEDITITLDNGCDIIEFISIKGIVNFYRNDGDINE